MNITVRLLTATLMGSLLAGCSHKQATDPRDPYEAFNRQVFKVNHCLDRTVLRPAAVVYNNLVAPPIQQGVSNAFDNLLEPEIMVNDLLQAKLNFALIDMTRMLINTILGFGGIIDVAKHIGLPYHSNDFGKTFAYWSANKQSAYVMLPFWGPSTIRDALGLPFAAATNPLFYFKSDIITYVPFTLSYVNLRAQLLPLDKLVDEAFDPYAAVRDAYLQHRNAQIAANDMQADYCRYRPAQDERTFRQEVTEGNLNSLTPPEKEFSFDDKTTRTMPAH